MKISAQNLARIVSEHNPNLRILYISGYTDAAILNGGIVESDTPFLNKPFTPSALLRKVREVLASGKKD